MLGRLIVTAAVLSAFIWAGAAAAQSAEEELAEKFAPVVRLKEQVEPCGPGEPYEPIDVDVLLDNVGVAFRGPWDEVNVVKVAPTADDLAQGFPDYHLDFPGEALSPGCTYEEWQQRLTVGSEPTMYARVVNEPGRPGQLALQYWFFYVFNDFNNKHEGDWEMIQLDFDAANAEDALAATPALVGYSQHEGAESAEWVDEKLEIVDGTHPVVYPAAGSHANFYTSQIFLGRTAAEGVGCDNTTGPSRDLRPAVALVPTDADAYLSAYPWLGFEGHWGELQPAFFNGPTGPNLKPQWTSPITWAEEHWREQAFALPGGDALMPQATTFFCEAVAAGSALLTKATRNPQGGLFLLVALAGVFVWGVTRTRWKPGAPLRLARRRATGQLLAAARRLYTHNVLLFATIGLIFIPIALLVVGLQAGLFLLTDLGALEDVAGASNPVLMAFVAGMSLIFTLIGLGLVQAVVAHAMGEIDAGRPVSARGAYREVLKGRRPLLGAILIMAAVITALSVTFFLVPVALWLLVRWSVAAQVVVVESVTAAAALRGSSRLVRRHWLRTLATVVGVAGIALTAGPFIGALALLGTDAAFWVTNLIAGIIYVFALPFVAVVTTYLYFDLRVRHATEPDHRDEVLPSELPEDPTSS